MDRLKKFYINGILMTLVALIIRYVSVNFNVYISSKMAVFAWFLPSVMIGRAFGWDMARGIMTAFYPVLRGTL